MTIDTVSTNRRYLLIKLTEMEQQTSIRVRLEIFEIVIYKGNIDWIVDLYYNNHLEDDYIDSNFFPLSSDGINCMLDHVMDYIGEEDINFI